MGGKAQTSTEESDRPISLSTLHHLSDQSFDVVQFSALFLCQELNEVICVCPYDANRDARLISHLTLRRWSGRSIACGVLLGAGGCRFWLLSGKKGSVS